MPELFHYRRSKLARKLQNKMGLTVSGGKGRALGNAAAQENGDR
jgi:hypothetical protein